MRVTCVKTDGFSGHTLCDIKNFDVHINNVFIIKTEFGLDIGRVVRKPFEMEIKKGSKGKNMCEFVKLANQDDFKKLETLRKKSQEAYNVGREKLKKHNLPMKLFSAKYMFDEKRLMFYFTAENRIDFRNFVKDLASVFKTRIELRQVSQREESKMVGGIGICGCQQCCVSYLDQLDSVSIKMAKDQNLSLNTIKISGNCGKLLCCLAYEYETYRELKKNFPKEGATVKVNVANINREKYIGFGIPSEGEISGKVRGGNILKNTVYLEIEEQHIIEVELAHIKKTGVLGVIK